MVAIIVAIDDNLKYCINQNRHQNHRQHRLHKRYLRSPGTHQYLFERKSFGRDVTVPPYHVDFCPVEGFSGSTEYQGIVFPGSDRESGSIHGWVSRYLYLQALCPAFLCAARREEVLRSSSTRQRDRHLRELGKVHPDKARADGIH